MNEQSVLTLGPLFLFSKHLWGNQNLNIVNKVEIIIKYVCSRKIVIKTRLSWRSGTGSISACKIKHFLK